MKKQNSTKQLLSLYFTLLFFTFSFAQSTINYTESTTDFPNPERGFYRHTETHASSYTALNAATLAGYRTSHTPSSANYSIYSTLILRVFYLDNFKTSPISSTFLTALQADFDAARTAGVKVIVRFAYTNTVDGSGCSNWICPPYGDASKAQIFEHIGQLKPYLHTNSDVIAAIQMGFIGVWGEQYYSDYFGDSSSEGQGYWSTSNWDDRIAVLDSLLKAVPDERMVQVRMPQIKQRTLYGSTAPTTAATITAAEAHKGSHIARIGFHNDCFLASASDFGTYTNYGSGPPIVSPVDDTTNLKPYTATDAKYTVVGGETCAKNGIWDDCSASGGEAENELARFHYSYLNSDYNNLDVNNDWVGTCIEDIKKKLGYRFVLENGTYDTEAQPNQVIDIAINLKNVGYAAPYNERAVELILRNTVNGTKYYAALTDDPRFWLSDASISHTLCIPNTIPTGTYDLLLNLPDTKISLYDNPDYSIQLANTGVWESSTGYNDLGHSITINNTASNATCNGEITFQLTTVYLPVDLIDFTAIGQKNQIDCRWQTAAEMNNRGFWLQRSTDGIHFENIIWQASKGNSTTTTTYHHTDKNVVSNTVYYYRLQQVDDNGKIEYSTIIQATINTNQNILTSLYPNPTTDRLQIEFANTFSGTLLISDALGNVHQQHLLSDTQKMNLALNQLNSGIYWLIFENAEGRFVEKILKE